MCLYFFTEHIAWLQFIAFKTILKSQDQEAANTGISTGANKNISFRLVKERSTRGFPTTKNKRPC